RGNLVGVADDGDARPTAGATDTSPQVAFDVAVGDPDQVAAKIREIRDAGVSTFIFSGYPHLTECDLVARHVLPRLRTH
ncbi:MAG: hypothetical protein ACKODN_06930, partial [Actinomycetota bacterium]